jgi:hypothetical protein
MKTYLFDGTEFTPEQVIDALEASNCGVEEMHDFIKPFSEEELEAVEKEYIDKSKELNQLQKELHAFSAPIKDKIKPIEKEAKLMINTINQGGERVTEKVYCFPDYETKLMGLYDSRGFLVGTRPMSRAERQLHINSNLSLNKAV